MARAAPVRSRLAAGLLSALLVTGCAHRVALTSNPAGATVALGGARVGVTPLELRVPLFGPRSLRVELTGYRPLEVRMGVFPPLAMELRLVEEHGPAGTWAPSDAP